MKALNKTVTKKYAYVKDGIIFNIKSINSGDACVVEMNETNVPYITTGKTATTLVKLYFDGYIEDGDTYSASTGFKKTIHSTSGGTDKSMTYQAYYRELCEKAISDSIIANYTWTYDDFANNLSRLGVPTWIFTQDPTIVEGIAKINFTREYYNASKEKRVKELAYSSACDIVDRYGYKLTTPAKAEDLVITKK
jgi:hypothetical protein